MSRSCDLDALLELWARWLIRGRCESLPNVCDSMFSIIHSHRHYYSGKGPKDSIEATIEAAVMSLAALDEKSATVLRVEFGVWVFNRSLRCPSQLEKAHSIRLPLPTYKKKLAKARFFIADKLAEHNRR